MTFSGKTDQLNIWFDALMEVEGSRLIANHACAENRSGAACQVRVLEGLNYAILNRGDILLSGNPEVIVPLDMSGAGRLIFVP